MKKILQVIDVRMKVANTRNYFSFVLLSSIMLLFTTCNQLPHYVDITGRVIDIDTGLPVAGLTVVADSYDYEDKMGFTKEVVSGSDGGYEIKHLHMAYTSDAFKNQTSSSFSLEIKDNDHYYGMSSQQVSKHTKKASQDIYAKCYSHIAVSVNVNSSINYYDGQVVEYSSSNENYLYGFKYTDVNKVFYNKTTFSRIFHTILTDSVGHFIKEQIDTIPYTGNCSTINYTITVN